MSVGTEDDIDGYIALDVELMVCATWGGVVALGANTGRGMLNFCISDAAKQMLLSNSGFIPHLVRNAAARVLLCARACTHERSVSRSTASC